MEDMIMNVKAIASTLNMSIGELAEKCGIEPNRLYNISSGRTKMLAEELAAIHEATGIPYENIQFRND